jgi:hypothetical protein
MRRTHLSICQASRPEPARTGAEGGKFLATDRMARRSGEWPIHGRNLARREWLVEIDGTAGHPDSHEESASGRKPAFSGVAEPGCYRGLSGGTQLGNARSRRWIGRISK